MLLKGLRGGRLVGRREGIVRFDSDFGAWCFDEGYQIQPLQECDQVAIRIHDCFLSSTVVLVRDAQCHLSFRDTVTWAKVEIALCRGCRYSAVLEFGLHPFRPDEECILPE